MYDGNFSFFAVWASSFFNFTTSWNYGHLQIARDEKEYAFNCLFLSAKKQFAQKKESFSSSFAKSKKKISLGGL